MDASGNSGPMVHGYQWKQWTNGTWIPVETVDKWYVDTSGNSGQMVHGYQWKQWTNGTWIPVETVYEWYMHVMDGSGNTGWKPKRYLVCVCQNKGRNSKRIRRGQKVTNLDDIQFFNEGELQENEKNPWYPKSYLKVIACTSVIICCFAALIKL